MKNNLKNNTVKFLNKNSRKLSYSNSSLIFLFTALVVLIIIVFPLVYIIKISVIKDGRLFFDGYIEVFKDVKTYRALKNTVILVLGVLAMSVPIGTILAFIRNKTDYKYNKAIDYFVFINFCIPSYVLSVAWIECISRGGFLHRILKMILPTIKYDISPYSLTAAIIVLSIHLYPLVYFAVGSGLKQISDILEKTSFLLGGSKRKTILGITIPLVYPTLISIGFLVFTRTIANFGVVSNLVLPIGTEVLTTRIFQAISELNLTVVAVLSILLMVISLAVFKISKRVKYKEIENTNNTIYYYALGKYRIGVNIMLSIFFSIALFIPLVTLLISSFLKRWGLPIEMEYLTLNNYKYILFESEVTKRAFANSIFFGIFSATSAVIITLFILYFKKHNNRLKDKLLFSISNLPLSMPNIVLAIGATFAWINPPFKLYGTKWIIIITYIALFIPIVLKHASGLSSNISLSIDDSAKTLGVPLIKRIFVLYMPQIFSGLLSGWIICFLISLREIPISLLLYRKGTETIGVMLFMIQSNSYGLETTSTLAVIVIIFSVIGNVLVKKIVKGNSVNERISD